MDLGWLGGLAHQTADFALQPTELNVGEDTLVAGYNGYHSGYEDGFTTGNHGFGHEQFGSDYGQDHGGSGIAPDA